MSGISIPHYDYGAALIINNSTSTLTKAQKIWRNAYAAIYYFRVMASLAKDIISNKKIEPSNYSPRRSEYAAGGIDHTKLRELVKDKNLTTYREFGGVEGISNALGTDPEKGINGNNGHDVNSRRRKFGSNTYKKAPAKGLLYFVVDAFKGITILILLVCAALSLGSGIKEHGAKEGWYEGGSIFVAVLLVVVVSAASNLRQERQFDKLSNISSDIKVDVLRQGRRHPISIFEIVVGDVVFLKIGDQIPADGVFLDGHSLQIDESSMIGESEHVEIDHVQNPFLFSGSKVADGYARMLVTSVGMNTAWGEMMSSIARDLNEQTPLQALLDKLTSSIGLAVAFLVLVVLLVRYFTGNTEDRNKEYVGSKTDVDDVMNAVISIVSVAVTIVMVAIPEGLPLALTLALAYSMKRMMSDQAMVRKLSACETMGSATMICTDKTGTLTLHQMKVTKFWVGEESMEDEKSPAIAPNVHKLIYQGVGLNTTGSVYESSSNSIPGVVFRNYTHEERMENVDKIRVMARSSPFDKLLMVQCLKQKGHVVAVTGDGTNDAPALKEAD